MYSMLFYNNPDHNELTLLETNKGIAFNSDLRQIYSPVIHMIVIQIMFKSHQENVVGTCPM
ncbi:hypothetical protein DERP_004748 [Dermatophagoides pteronyssinus]|uniref:Uncharacterized protein n=1 Tax=Dermatophagoides pteronyssinus TaxID=6956 RepID=A0ABQ8JQ79_DERPT|nr:hypothetical protein DERP_004748 [Dermatophagoides pteronyssinus]